MPKLYTHEARETVTHVLISLLHACLDYPRSSLTKVCKAMRMQMDWDLEFRSLCLVLVDDRAVIENLLSADVHKLSDKEFLSKAGPLLQVLAPYMELTLCPSEAQDYMFVLKIYEKVCAAGEEDIEAAPVFIEHEGSMILIQDCRRPNWRFPPRGVGQPRGHLLTPVIQGTAEVANVPPASYIGALGVAMLAEDQALIEESVMTLFEQCHRPLSAWYQTRMQRGHAPQEERLTWAAYLRYMATGLCGIDPCMMVDPSPAAHQAQAFGHLLCSWILTGATITLTVVMHRDPEPWHLLSPR